MDLPAGPDETHDAAHEVGVDRVEEGLPLVQQIVVETHYVLRLWRVGFLGLSVRQHPSAYVSILEHMSASVSIRHYPSAHFKVSSGQRARICGQVWSHY